MTVKIVIDTTVVIEAFATENKNNLCRRFLQEFATQQHPPERVICLDLPPHRIYEDYKRALKSVPFPDAETAFDNWYNSLSDDVISVENGRVERFDENHKSVLREAKCEENSEVAFVARSVHNNEDEGRVLVVEPCDLIPCRNTFLRTRVANYLGKMGIEIILVEDAPKKIESIIKKQKNTVEAPSCMSDLERRKQAYIFLKNYFAEHELKELCFLMGINSDSLAGVTGDEFARELIEYCERRVLISDLLRQCNTLRPLLTWPDPWEYNFIQ